MPKSSRQLTDDDAQPLDSLMALSAQVVYEVRSSLEDGRCQLIPSESTFPRVYSLAAMSHECLLLDELCKLAASDSPSELLALVARHHLETWITGAYLVLGCEEAFAKLRGEADRARMAMQKEIRTLQKTGGLAGVDASVLDDDSDWELQRFAYQTAFEEVDRIGAELGLLQNVKAMYAIANRALSSDLGARPTFKVLDRYVDMANTFAKIEFSAASEQFRRRPIQLCLVLTALQATIIFEKLRFPLDAYSYSDVIQQLGPPARSPMLDEPDA